MSREESVVDIAFPLTYNKRYEYITLCGLAAWHTVLMDGGGFKREAGIFS